jgi:uncharacterized protein YggU (UPF0235/DUF167 family)
MEVAKNSSLDFLYWQNNFSIPMPSKKISIKAKPGSKVAGITEKNGQLIVAVKERAADGNANRAVEKAIAKYFGIAPSRVRIIAGAAAREKVIEIV